VSGVRRTADVQRTGSRRFDGDYISGDLDPLVRIVLLSNYVASTLADALADELASDVAGQLALGRTAGAWQKLSI
jgi:hypothetical protein